VDPVRFVTEDGVQLEGELRMPDGPTRASAVLCHPHPRHGGSKDHPILWAIRNALANRGFGVLGFNFRGVMGSGGAFGGGRLEVRDVRAAIDRVGMEAPGLPLLLVGWSFGASVALREALDDARAGALALIGTPLRPGDIELPSLPPATELHAFARPVLFVAGSGDGFCPADDLRIYAAALPRATVKILEGTDHYLWRREHEAATLVADFAEASLVSG
jgi:alpha/beta superfamily hydrolase